MVVLVLTWLLAFAIAAPSATAQRPQDAVGGGMMGAPVHHHRQATGAGMRGSDSGPMMEGRPSVPGGRHHDGGLSSAALAGIIAVVVAALAVVVLIVHRPSSRGRTPSTP